jgi:L-asparaginase II
MLISIGRYNGRERIIESTTIVDIGVNDSNKVRVLAVVGNKTEETFIDGYSRNKANSIARALMKKLNNINNQDNS